MKCVWGIFGLRLFSLGSGVGSEPPLEMEYWLASKIVSADRFKTPGKFTRLC